MIGRDYLRIGLDIAVLCLFIYSAVEALSFSRLARYMPLYVSIGGIIASFGLLCIDLLRVRASDGLGVRWSAGIEDYEPVDSVSLEVENEKLKITSYYLLWIIGYLALVAVVGLPVASVLFLVVFLRIDAQLSMLAILLSVIGLIVTLQMLAHFVDLRWPSNLMGW